MPLIISNLILVDGWRRLGIAFLAGAIASLAQSPLGLFPLLWICLPVLVWLLDSACLGKAAKAAASSMFGVGWSFGFGFFLLTFYWIGSALLVEADKFAWALPLAILVLPAGLALFWGAACASLSLVWSNTPLRVFWLALSFSAWEWLRGTILTGLPWGGFGPSLASNEVMMQALALVGPDAMTLFAVLIFSLPALLLTEADHSTLGRRLALAIGLIFATQLAYGVIRLSGDEKTDPDAPVIRLIQPNIPQTEKWKFENRSWIFNRLLALTTLDREDAPSDDVDLVIWPESAVPFYLIEQPGALAAIAQALPEKAGLVTGALRREINDLDGERVYNAIYQIGRDGTVLASYDKVHLVPFGEYLPVKPVLEAIGLEQLTAQKRGFAVGAQRKLLEDDIAGAMLPLVCYEIAFSSEILTFPKSADWIVNVTNDAWFGATAGPWQHLHLARMRAVETGLPVVRVANTGISAIIDAKGRILRYLSINSDDLLQDHLPPKMEKTVYLLFGNWIFLGLWVFFALATTGLGRKVTKSLSYN